MNEDDISIYVYGEPNTSADGRKDKVPSIIDVPYFYDENSFIKKFIVRVVDIPKDSVQVYFSIPFNKEEVGKRVQESQRNQYSSRTIF